MKKQRFLTFLLSTIMLFSGIFIASCGAQSEEDSSSDVKLVPPSLYQEAIFPSEPSNLDVEVFKSDYLNSEYCDKSKEFTAEIYNYMPETHAKRYNIGAFQVSDGEYSNYYFWHDGGIYPIAYTMNNTAKFHGFVQFFLSDIDCDGNFEWISSFYTENKLKISYLSAYDSATKLMADDWGIYDKVAFFKEDPSSWDSWAIYTSEDNNINNATTKYSDISRNSYSYSFAKKTYQVVATDYMVDITINETTINFPIYFKNLRLGFTVNTNLTWLGESFSYENSTTLLEGASIELSNESHTLEFVSIGAGDAITWFEIQTGQVIEFPFTFEESAEKRNEVGTCDMKVGYCFSEEQFVLDDVLTIVGI